MSLKLALLLLLVTNVGLQAQEGDTIWQCPPVELTISDTLDVIEWRDANGDVITRVDNNGIIVNDLSPVVSPSDTTTYSVLYSDLKRDNVLINGDFESPISDADARLMSDYTYHPTTSPTPIGGGNFGIGTNPSHLYYWYYDQLKDHTKGDGTGKMYYADGSSDLSTVYRTTVNVVKGEVYVLSAWLANIDGKPWRPLYKMNFYVNNDLVGSLEGNKDYFWHQYYDFWLSDVTGPVEVKYVNINTAGQGNDFAIDDLVFATTSTKEVTVIPPHDPPIVVTKDTTIILGAELKESLTAEQLNDGSFVNCGVIDSMSIDISTFGCEQIGDNTVTLTVWSYGLSSSGEATVTVVDDSSYCSVATKDTSIILGANLKASVSAEQILDVSYPPYIAGVVDSMSIDVSDFGCEDIGDNTVVLTIWSSGFSSSEEATVTVVDDSSYCSLDVPKGFSPNGDTKNDFLIIDNMTLYDHVSIEIYNRWGSLVFENDAYQDGSNNWDGKSNVGASAGEDLSVGTYYYLLNIYDLGIVHKGSVYLSR